MRPEELQKQAKRHIRRPTIKRDKKNTQLIRPTRTALNIHSVNGNSFLKFYTICYMCLHYFINSIMYCHEIPTKRNFNELLNRARFLDNN